ncbi:hypothetical protein [Enterococcus sp. CSURQ0835]|uniref:hypothetical protein n=1 Tax=Enterococcus sp. CSURQ0835 TaxID=2681394 RepID=UPI00135700CE|nr:hypothetical protein [Enterococcus sp. CSURQ0835]
MLNLVLSFFIFTLILFICSDILNGKKIEQALYSDVSELHISYRSDVNYGKIIDEFVEISKKNNTNISQYMFTARNKLTIISTNPYKNKYLQVKKGASSSFEDDYFASNQNSNSPKKLGSLNLPSHYLQVKLFSVDHFKDVGLSNILYVQGDVNSVEKILIKYGTVKKTRINESDTYVVNQYQITITIYLLVLFFVSLSIVSFSNRKKTLLKKNFGYTKFHMMIDSIKETNVMLYGLFLAVVVYLYVIRDVTISFMLSFLLSLVLCIFFTLVYMLIQMLILYYGRIYSTVKGRVPIRMITFLLTIILCVTLFLGLTIFGKIEQNFIEYTNINSKLNTWKKVEGLYKTNITNQMDRNNVAEEKQYLSSAQNFYNAIKNKYDTFIIAPYNYAVIDHDKNGQPISVGQSRFHGDKHASTVNMGGIDIFIDMNYLKRNPIVFSDHSEINKINVEKDTISLLIPEKYKIYEDEIKTNYLKYLKFIINEEPPNQDIQINKLSINSIYVKNNQKYFTYNHLYGDSRNNYAITDPISIIVNPHMMSGLFWGNILTVDGGLYLDFKDSNNDIVFNKLKNEIENANLKNTINFTVSAFQDYGTYVSKIQSSLFNSLLQGVTIICLFVMLNFQLVSLLFRIKRKKIFLEKTLGYSVVYRMLSVSYLAVLTDLISLSLFMIVNPSKLLYLFPALLIIMGINILIYGVLCLQSKKITLMEELNDI